MDIKTLKKDSLVAVGWFLLAVVVVLYGLS
jgi:hypothetical protein